MYCDRGSPSGISYLLVSSVALPPVSELMLTILILKSQPGYQRTGKQEQKPLGFGVGHVVGGIKRFTLTEKTKAAALSEARKQQVLLVGTTICQHAVSRRL